MEDKETMKNLTSINMTLSHSLNQEQEKSLVLSKKIQALQTHTNPKIPATEKPATHNKQYTEKSKSCLCNHGSTRSLDHTRQPCRYNKKGHQLGATLENRIGRSDKWYKEHQTH